MGIEISGTVQRYRGKLSDQSQREIQDRSKVHVQYVRDASRWNVFKKVAAWVPPFVGVFAAMAGSYKRRLVLSNKDQPKPIETGISRTDWKKVLKASQEPNRIASMSATKQAQLRSVAIKLIGSTSQDQGLSSLWQKLDLDGQTADLVELAVHCVADRTGEFREEVFNALRDTVKQTHQQRNRSEAFEQMRGEFKADEAQLREKIGEVSKPASPHGSLRISELLPKELVDSLVNINIKIKPEHFDQVRPLIAEFMRMPQGLKQEEQAEWLNKLLKGHQDAVRVLVLINDPNAPEEMDSLTDLLGIDRKIIEALKEALDIDAISEDIEQKLDIPVGSEAAQTFARNIDDTVAAYDFSEFTNALDGLTEGLPPELGGFMTDVMNRYFANQTPEDKKMMLASLYQHGNSTNQMDHLVALLKGAGPFMQKIMQQLGSEAKNAEVANALQQLKENLNPIDDEDRLVLLSAVMRNVANQGERMSNIRVLSSASVAETLAVTLEPPEGSSSKPREVVVKLLRPGIVHRAGRERAFFDQVAKDRAQRAGGANDAIARTMGSISDQIESELDLRLEAAEIQKAQVYAARPEVQSGGIQIMTMAAGQAANAEFLILDRMPGGSVKSFIAEMKNAAQKQAPTPEEREKLETLNTQGEALCQQLISLNSMWVKEAFFGSGFFHGDLHSGNVMVDTTDPATIKLGLIDFGNAATLDPTNQRNFLRIQAAITNGHPERAVDALRALLPASARARLDEVRPMLVMELKGLMVKEQEKLLDPNFHGVQRDLLGDFLSAATTLGLEIPGSLLQFGRSQSMLTNTFEEARMALQAVKNKLSKVDESRLADAFEEAADQATTGNLRALVGKAGLGFAIAVRNDGDYQQMRRLITDSDAGRALSVDRAQKLKAAEAELKVCSDTFLNKLKDYMENAGRPAGQPGNDQWKENEKKIRDRLKIEEEVLTGFLNKFDHPESVGSPYDWLGSRKIIREIGAQKELDDLCTQYETRTKLESQIKDSEYVDAWLKHEREEFQKGLSAKRAAPAAGPVGGVAPPQPELVEQIESAAAQDHKVAMQQELGKRMSNHIRSDEALQMT